jgi:hypothetical protein
MQQSLEAARAWETEQARRDQEARQQLEQHARDLAAEARCARARALPPGYGWLQPWDPRYVDPEEWRIQQELLRLQDQAAAGTTPIRRDPDRPKAQGAASGSVR